MLMPQCNYLASDFMPPTSHELHMLITVYQFLISLCNYRHSFAVMGYGSYIIEMKCDHFWVWHRTFGSSVECDHFQIDHDRIGDVLLR